MTSTASMFFRHGQPVPASLHISRSETGKATISRLRSCTRCGGMGGGQQWAHTGWTCYECGGSGRGGPETVPVYTSEQIAKLDAIMAKKMAKAEAAAAAKRLAAQVEADARRVGFLAEHGEAVAWLREAVRAEESRKGLAEGEAEGFMADMLRRADHAAEWTEAQAAGVRKIMAARAEAAALRAASGHLGAVGERLDVPVTVERVSDYGRASFSGYGIETVYIVTMRDDAGNAIVSKSPSFSPKAGTSLRLRATVKEHSTFRGENQTVVTRAQDVEAAAARRKADAENRKRVAADWAAMAPAEGAEINI